MLVVYEVRRQSGSKLPFSVHGLVSDIDNLNLCLHKIMGLGLFSRFARIVGILCYIKTGAFPDEALQKKS
jgi:hypothetical protein